MFALPAVPRLLRLPRLALPAAALAALLAVLAAPAASQAFEVYRHANMAGEVLATQGVPGVALAYIKQGCRLPDLDGCREHCYCPSWLQWAAGCHPDSSTIVNLLSADHFDNNRLDESILTVNARVDAARGILLGLAQANPKPAGWRRDFALALIVFGKALHAVQDFYAHSNWMECQRDLVRIGGSIADLPMWNGEQWGCSTVIGGVTVNGLQTGYVDIATPAGSVTHDALNKDSPSSTQGAIQIRRIFPSTVIATYYETVSGQLGGTTNAYTNDGVAPRHTIRAWEAVLYGTAVYNNGPVKAGGYPQEISAAAAAEALAIGDLLAEAEADPEVQELAQLIDTLLADWDVNDPSAYPYDDFDADGLPLDTVAAVPAFAPAQLDQNYPNPFNPVTTIRFHLARADRVSLVIYDLGGHRVRTLVDADLAPGSYSEAWDGRDQAGQPVPAGSYLYVLGTGDWNRSQRMVLVK
jgi:hypothetical protein